jgi:hypothetical protein
MNVFDKLRQYLFLRQLRRQAARDVRFPKWDKVRTILLIYDSDLMEKNADIREIMRRMMLDDKQVSLLGYVERKDVQSPILPQSRMMGWRDRNWLYQLSKEMQDYISENEYDLIIDLTQTACLPLHYAALFAKARFKAGRHIVDGLHDFDIEMPGQESHTPLFDQIVHYLQTIESKD